MGAFTILVGVMKRLDLYLGKTLLSTILVVGLILMSIEMLVTFIGELGNIGTGSYGILQALRFVILDMPFQLNDLFPMAGLVGSLVAMGLLASQVNSLLCKHRDTVLIRFLGL